MAATAAVIRQSGSRCSRVKSDGHLTASGGAGRVTHVAGRAALSERFGRLPFIDLMQPAVGYARDDFAVSVVAQKRGPRRSMNSPHSRALPQPSCPMAVPPRLAKLGGFLQRRAHCSHWREPRGSLLSRGDRRGAGATLCRLWGRHESRRSGGSHYRTAATPFRCSPDPMWSHRAGVRSTPSSPVL